MAESDPKQDLQVQVEIQFPSQPVVIRHINFVRFSHLGHEVFMDFGNIDDEGIRKAKSDPAGARTVNAFVHGRFAFSPEGLTMLISQSLDIASKMEAAGLLKDIRTEIAAFARGKDA